MDAAISCLPPPPPALLATTNFADAAIARALHFSMSSAASSSSSSLSATAHHHQSPLALLAADLPPYAPHAATCVDSVLVADSPRRSPPAAPRQHQHQHQNQLAPAGGRAGKRRSRASKRDPTTYITTDPSNFRIMVQQITGAQADPGEVDMLLQPTTVLLGADTSADGAYGDHPLLALPGGDEASSAALRHHHQQQQLQPCFPTLDSWNVMYESNELPPPL